MHLMKGVREIAGSIISGVQRPSVYATGRMKFLLIGRNTRSLLWTKSCEMPIGHPTVQVRQKAVDMIQEFRREYGLVT